MVIDVEQQMQAMYLGYKVALNAEYTKRTEAEKLGTHLQIQWGTTNDALRRCIEENTQLREKLLASEIARREIQELAQKYRVETEKLVTENAVLRSLQHQQAEELVKAKAGNIGNITVEGAVAMVKAEFGKQMEARIAALVKEMQADRMLRTQTERKYADAMKKLKSVSVTWKVCLQSSMPIFFGPPDYGFLLHGY